jgi:hypothetical protein
MELHLELHMDTPWYPHGLEGGLNSMDIGAPKRGRLELHGYLPSIA